MKIILISGHAESGKDFSASIIKRKLEDEGKKVIIVKYGDFLKSFCKNSLGWNGKKDEPGRSLLQYWGTNVIRKRNESTWVKIVDEVFHGIDSEFDYALISDVRFPNEICYWYSSDYPAWTIRVDRRNHENALTPEQRNHPSETALDNWPFDYILENDGTVDGITKKIVECFDFMKRKSFLREVSSASPSTKSVSDI